MASLESPLPARMVRALDQRAIEEYGIPSLLLMENAGRAAAQVALAILGAGPPSEPVLCFCGPGNNGGDGLVVARTLSNHGVPVRAFLVGGLDRLEGASTDVRTNVHLWLGLGHELESVASESELAPLSGALAAAPLLVDGLFGTGLSRPLEGLWLTVVEALDRAPAPVLALDLPSGLHADSGEELGAVVRAEATVTFCAPKPGLGRGVGPERCGRVHVAEIGIPRAFVEEAYAELAD